MGVVSDGNGDDTTIFFFQTIVIPSPCGSLAQVFVQGALAKILFTGAVAKVSTVTDFASCATGDDDEVTRCTGNNPSCNFCAIEWNFSLPDWMKSLQNKAF